MADSHATISFRLCSANKKTHASPGENIRLVGSYGVSWRVRATKLPLLPCRKQDSPQKRWFPRWYCSELSS